ncbi:MAG: beta-ketoacyl-ACP synthase II [Myxococcales bacterium]|nr:MAG: beta-ketoacyl-ACP synthase II [Myxococcales bacterium]
MTRRVVVTGLGVLCPVGNTVEESWTALLEGKSGINTIHAWAENKWANENLGVTIGGEVKNFDPANFIEPKKDIRRMGRFIHLAMAASQEAWRMAQLPDKLDDEMGNRAGCVLGVGMIGMEVFTDNYDALLEKGPRRVSPFFIPGTISNLAPGQIAIRRNLRLDNWSVVSACASGTHAIGEAFSHIKYGRADLMLCGGAESALHPMSAAGFNSMHALCSSKNDQPKKASRPFDKTRDGFVMGEGAGIFILEELEHAKKRNAPIIAELVGYGSTCDAHHITAPSENGEGAQRAIRQALACANLSPKDISYINAHGTSTPLNDKYETIAIKSVFGDHAYQVPVSSTKSMTGHLLGAAGGVEGVFSAMAIKTDMMPPTINLEYPDPQCDLDYIPNKARTGTVEVAMSNSFGFGGANAVIILRKYR